MRIQARRAVQSFVSRASAPILLSRLQLRPGRIRILTKISLPGVHLGGSPPLRFVFFACSGVEEVEDASTWAECAKFVEGEEPLREDGFCEGKAEDDFLEGSVLVEAISAPEVRASGGGDAKGIQTLIHEGMWTSEGVL